LVETTTEEVKPPSDATSSTSTSKKRKRKEKREALPKVSRAEPVPGIEYDETLLAIVGILDVVKHQSNVASWVKTSGLWGPYPPQNLPTPNINASTHDHLHNNREDVVTLSDSESVDSGRRGERKKQRRDTVAVSSKASVTEGPENSDLHRAPTNEKKDESNTSEAPMWFDNPLTTRYWADRGRSALETLGIPVEHGLKH